MDFDFGTSNLGAFAVIVVTSVVQSIVGVGILVFGTPSFLLLGFSLPEAVGHLLPVSLVVSLLQILKTRKGRPKIDPGLYALCLPVIVITFLITIFSEVSRVSAYIVGAMLIVSSIMRLYSGSRERIW